MGVLGKSKKSAKLHAPENNMNLNVKDLESTAH